MLLVPVSITVPYERLEQYDEEYVVIEPRDIQIADYDMLNFTANESFEDTKYVSENLKYTVNVLCKKDISYITQKFVYKDWEKYLLITYGSDQYFAGYKKGPIVSSDTHTFDVKSKSGYVYNVIIDDNKERVLKEGDYLTLENGYDIQINDIMHNVKKSKIVSRNTGHYEEEENDNDYKLTYSTRDITYTNKTLMSLRYGNNIVDRIEVGIGTYIYTEELDGGERMPMIIVHISNISDDNVTVDAVFQISKRYAQISELGAEITVTIKNIDTHTGMFKLWQGFDTENNTKIGRFSDAYIWPSKSASFTYTTSKDVVDCEYYLYDYPTKAIENEFTNYKDVMRHTKGTKYRNVTLYVDIIKTRTVEGYVSGYEEKRVIVLQKILGWY